MAHDIRQNVLLFPVFIFTTRSYITSGKEIGKDMEKILAAAKSWGISSGQQIKNSSFMKKTLQ
jgi:hypothetical protein